MRQAAALREAAQSEGRRQAPYSHQVRSKAPAPLGRPPPSFPNTTTTLHPGLHTPISLQTPTG
eukprot:346662-Chlamydomonas_euryale.AAC.1